MDLTKRLQQLYRDGESFDYGALVYAAPGIRELQENASGILLENYKKDVAILSLGFNYGHASFVDILIGKSRCASKKTIREDAAFDNKCLFLLLCDYLEIYVLGEHDYRDNSHLLPHFDSVDSFKSECVSSLADDVTHLLGNSGYERVYSNELNSPLPSEIKLESNLGRGLVFDGYFNWTD